MIMTIQIETESEKLAALATIIRLTAKFQKISEDEAYDLIMGIIYKPLTER